MLYGADGPTVHVHPEFAVGTRRNYWSCRLSRTSTVVVFGTGWSGVTRGGIARGLAFRPAVSPRARARGFYGAGGGVGRAISPALQASERQDAEASLHGVSAGQDARSERPARWHGQPRPTQDVASSAISPALQASERQDAEAKLARSELSGLRYRSAAWRISAGWRAWRPVPSAIWWRQLVPGAARSTSAGAARTAGKSTSSPILIDTSKCSRS